ncbi:MAG: hypothetical protein P8X90_26705, partial [Desulfobacterales bacterium]
CSRAIYDTDRLCKIINFWPAGRLKSSDEQAGGGFFSNPAEKDSSYKPLELFYFLARPQKRFAPATPDFTIKKRIGTCFALLNAKPFTAQLI